MYWVPTQAPCIKPIMAKAEQRQYCLVIMAKAPLPGRVKTRLATRLGKPYAARVYAHLLAGTLQRLGAVNGQKVLSCAPDTNHATFRKLSHEYGWQCIPQINRELGKRMSNIIVKYQKSAEYVIITGSDLANLNDSFIEACVQQLANGHDLVLGATQDGGYGLIGMARLHAALFRNIPWSTARVLSVTLRRAGQLKLKTAIITDLLDIDTYQNYRQWKQLEQAHSHLAITSIKSTRFCYHIGIGNSD